MLELQLDLESRGRYPKTVEELVQVDDLLAGAITIRRWAAWAGPNATAVCSMYSNGRVAQLSGLFTFEEYRRKRNGYAVLAAALHAAAAEHDLVFGIAEAGGWRERWFQRMGFQPVAERAEAVRTVGATATRV
jgi:GNAT superfamily N-acetyltransferase